MSRIGKLPIPLPAGVEVSRNNGHVVVSGPKGKLEREIAAGIEVRVCESGGVLAGVMGIQPVRDVDLIRHAYVRPENQGQGIGGALLRHLTDGTGERILIGTWAAAEWAIGFYRKHGFVQVTPELKDRLLRTYWNIPERQMDTSVVLARPAFE